MDLDQYQPIEEFAKAYESISFYEQQQENAPYDIEQTIRVINAIELAQVRSENFDEFLDFMARQDYTGVDARSLGCQAQTVSPNGIHLQAATERRANE